LRRVRIRYQIECLLAVLSAAALVLSLLVPTWIEQAFRLRPDANTGATEWTVTIGLLMSTTLLVLQVRLDRRRLLNASSREACDGCS
jgi:hypothetical protein